MPIQIFFSILLIFKQTTGSNDGNDGKKQYEHGFLTKAGSSFTVVNALLLSMLTALVMTLKNKNCFSLKIFAFWSHLLI